MTKIDKIGLPDPPPLPPEEMLPLLKSIRRIVRASDLGSRALQKTSGLTAPQLAVLTAVGSLGEISTTRIAEQVDLSAATVVTILDNLERHQLVTRHRSSEDRRIVFTRTTPAGVAVLARALGPFSEAFARRFAALAPDHRRRMVKTLAELADLLNAADGPPAPDS
ncbi:MarR family winged helix-turn-helix transcriptional regulator [Mesorhizobium sp. ZMM04-5]|uniref:MarR family winged helix-turn-helix transcriptional regulator n=1 Tax=Mesorhizobium marinum TaxID=3228790 RepID=A0ABV3R198_9HYPH